jgi:hypothetical protein
MRNALNIILTLWPHLGALRNGWQLKSVQTFILDPSFFLSCQAPVIFLFNLLKTSSSCSFYPYYSTPHLHFYFQGQLEMSLLIGFRYKKDFQPTARHETDPPISKSCHAFSLLKLGGSPVSMKGAPNSSYSHSTFRTQICLLVLWFTWYLFLNWLT